MRPIIETAGKGTDDGGANDAVEACIKEMSAADPMSFSFRYPVEKGGKPMVLAFETVDLGNLRRTMRKIANYFDGLDGLLDHLMVREAVAVWRAFCGPGRGCRPGHSAFGITKRRDLALAMRQVQFRMTRPP